MENNKCNDEPNFQIWFTFVDPISIPGQDGINMKFKNYFIPLVNLFCLPLKTANLEVHTGKLYMKGAGSNI